MDESRPVGVSVVVPVYRSTVTLVELASRVHAHLAAVAQFEIILVDDGSPSETWATIQELTQLHNWITGIRLSRNFGQHNALVAGVRAAQYNTVITIDDDLQNPPEEIPRLLDELASGGYDVVYGVPERVEQSVFRKAAGRVTRVALSSGLGISSAPDVSSFRAFRTDLRDAFSDNVGTNVSLDALLSWGGANFGSVKVRHDAREVGKSNYSLGRLIRFAIDTTTGYSALPLQAASVLGLVMAGFGVVILGYVLIRPLVTGQSVEGFPFLASIIAIFSGVQLFTLGVIGEYLARMHFRVMNKPTYVVREIAVRDPITAP